ncbi:uncharacterized protein LOC121104370 [Ursus maritimus]|uniref:Uncharacterized protein LOC121104370 n=1 Tax=Ursus maritimus TaxID=29073 RepID=A0A8M1GBK2_URSMA|nr:uncharacterized protein LOC121104370 [Ursus maritimus]
MVAPSELGRHHALVSPSPLRVRDQGSGLWDAEGVCPRMIGAGSSANPSSSNGKHLTNEGRQQRRGIGGAEPQLDGHKRPTATAALPLPRAPPSQSWAAGWARTPAGARGAGRPVKLRRSVVLVFCTECSLDSSSRACVAPGYCQRQYLCVSAEFCTESVPMQTNEGEVSEESSSKVEQEDFVMEGHGKTPPPGEESKHKKQRVPTW